MLGASISMSPCEGEDDGARLDGTRLSSSLNGSLECQDWSEDERSSKDGFGESGGDGFSTCGPSLSA